MEIKVQIVVRSEAGESEVLEVARLERSALRVDTLGLSLAEARCLLAELQQAMAERQAAEWVAQARRCPACGQERACKGHHAIVCRTPLGRLSLSSPRLYRCRCEAQTLESFSPLAERLPERRSPELTYLETKFAALVSYGLTVKLLEEVLPIGQDLSTRTIRRQVRRVAGRLEAELGDEVKSASEAVLPGQKSLTGPAAPLVVGLDGAYVHAKGQHSRTEGWFEVIVGKRLPAQDQAPKCFGFVSRYDAKPKRRLYEWLKAQGLPEDRPVTFLSDGGDTVCALPMNLHPRSEHLLDWFYVILESAALWKVSCCRVVVTT